MSQFLRLSVLQCKTLFSSPLLLEAGALRSQILAPSRAMSSPRWEQPLLCSAPLRHRQRELIWLQVLLKFPFKHSAWKKGPFCGVFLRRRGRGRVWI